MKLLRLRGRKICDRVLRKGKVWRGQTMMIRWLPGFPFHPAANPRESAVYSGTVASRALSTKAVERNRMRRRCREALRITLRELSMAMEKQKPSEGASVQLLLCPRSPSLRAPFTLLLSDIERFLSTLPFPWSRKKPPLESSSSSSSLRSST